MNAKGISKSFFALALAAGLVVQGINPVFADGGKSSSGSGDSQQSQRSGLHDNTHLGEVDGTDAEGLVVHFPSVFDSYIPGKIANSGGRPPLMYRGGITANGITGGVSQAPKVYLVFWGSQWGTTGTVKDAAGVDRTTFSNDPKGLAPYVQSLLAGLGTNSETWSQVMQQYCDGVAVGATTCAGNVNAKFVGYPTGGALAGVWYDNSAVAPTTASQIQLAAEAKAAALHFGNTTPISNASTQYVVVSATGMHPNGFNAPLAWCAWHDYASDPAIGNFAYTNLPYVPDAGASCGANYVNGADGALDGVGIVEGHEYTETVTDQWPAGGWTDAAGYENGDDCSWTGPTGGQGGNLVLSTGTFAMQGSWSNIDSDCSMGSVNVIGSGLPTAKTGAAYATTAVSGGFTPYVYSNVSGALPAGLTLGTDGRITGTSNASVGTYTQTLTVTDSKGSVITGTITLNLALAIATSVTVSASSTSATTSTPVTLSATLLAPGGTAAGQSLTFKDGTTVLGSAVTNVNGVATLASRTFTGGSHSITATFGATGLYLASTSPAVVVSVAAAVSSLVLGTSVTTGINPTTSVSLSATLSPVIASATITFFDGATSLGTARTNTAGVATLAKTFTAGAHTLTAKFAGTTAATASTSAAVVITSAITTPGAPTAPRLTKGGTAAAPTATATWTAPTSTGGSAITAYTVYVFQGTTLIKTVPGPTSRSVVITGLQSKAVLNIKVSATNIAGEGPQSVASATATMN
jgi:Bacterial Ig-like domain (group 3)/Putative Ig domain/Fibronectin type III domain